ncbi:MAG TPA: hydroxymethylglutaryl-CoA lyase [Vicinamibacteria bacterium]|nr:hydroxymethylglutaryl-CoA lyase [Vicinamibacteria bacterium]
MPDPPRIQVHEVALRDGLQMEEGVVPTPTKLAWARSLLRSGVDVVQVGSFVHPEKVPQMADTDALFAALAARSGGPPGPPGPLLSALVLNEKGLERALRCRVDLVCMGVSASETHSRKNTGMSVAEATARIIQMAWRARGEGRRVQVSVQSAFGCGYEGVVTVERVLGIVQSFLDAGLDRISLADTAGRATPDDVERLYGLLRQAAPAAELACHFHDTYGLALANCYAALRAGVTSFEGSVGGLGGCPFTAVAGGNLCTEDFVHALQRAGQRLDVDLVALVDLARDMAAFLGRELPGAVYKAGPIAQPQEVS